MNTFLSILRDILAVWGVVALFCVVMAIVNRRLSKLAPCRFCGSTPQLAHSGTGLMFYRCSCRNESEPRPNVLAAEESWNIEQTEGWRRE